jgi:hypothetical protein
MPTSANITWRNMLRPVKRPEALLCWNLHCSIFASSRLPSVSEPKRKMDRKIANSDIPLVTRHSACDLYSLSAWNAHLAQEAPWKKRFASYGYQLRSGEIDLYRPLVESRHSTNAPSIVPIQSHHSIVLSYRDA